MIISVYGQTCNINDINQLIQDDGQKTREYIDTKTDFFINEVNKEVENNFKAFTEYFNTVVGGIVLTSGIALFGFFLLGFGIVGFMTMRTVKHLLLMIDDKLNDVYNKLDNKVIDDTVMKKDDKDDKEKNKKKNILLKMYNKQRKDMDKQLKSIEELQNKLKDLR